MKFLILIVLLDKNKGGNYINTFFGRKTTDSPTHRHERIQILLQTIISFLMQSSHSSKFCPIKLPSVGIKYHSKCRDNSIKVSFFSSCPSVLNQIKKKKATLINDISLTKILMLNIMTIVNLKYFKPFKG